MPTIKTCGQCRHWTNSKDYPISAAKPGFCTIVLPVWALKHEGIVLRSATSEDIQAMDCALFDDLNDAIKACPDCPKRSAP